MYVGFFYIEMTSLFRELSLHPTKQIEKNK